MSAKIMGKVWDLDLPHNKLIVLLAMADHADHEGKNVFPSQGLIAWKTGYSVKQVRRIIQDLVEDEILVEVAKSVGIATCYYIDLKKGSPKPPYTPDKKSQATSDKMSEVATHGTNGNKSQDVPSTPDILSRDLGQNSLKSADEPVTVNKPSINTAAKSAAADTSTDFPVVTSTEVDKAIFTPSQENSQTPANAGSPSPSSAAPLPVDDRPNIFKVYEDVFGTIPGAMVDVLKDAAKTWSEVWIKDALLETAKGNGKSWKYTERILERWQREGKPQIALVPKSRAQDDTPPAKVWTPDDLDDFYAANGIPQPVKKVSGDDSNGKA